MKTVPAALAAAIVVSAAGHARGQSFTESFDSVSTLPPLWALRNNSEPLGTNGWFQGNPNFFPAQASTGYVAANVNSTTQGGTISNWLMTPERVLTNGDTMQFWTRTVANTTFPDRLQVRMSTAGASTNVGSTAASVGDFTELLLDINPNYTNTGYPAAWTQFLVSVSGLAAPTPGRFAFRYFVENGGPGAPRSSYIGIDTVEYIVGGVQSGACCLASGQCVVQTAAGCASLSGVYRGNNTPCATANCPQPPSGACCRPDGTCAVLTLEACDAAGGIYRGNSSACGGVTCPRVFTYTGAAVAIPDGAGSATCGAEAIAAVNVAESFTIASAEAAFHMTHHWQGDVVITLEKVGGPSVVLVDRPGVPATTFGFSNDNFGASASALFRSNDSAPNIYDLPATPGLDNPTGNWKPENPLAAFNGLGSAGTWRLKVKDCAGGGIGSVIAFQLSLSQPSAPACYANCDGSTTPPILNVNDFICFQGLYAAGDTRANCDGSTTQPVLNVNDFICFQGRYAAGCP